MFQMLGVFAEFERSITRSVFAPAFSVPGEKGRNSAGRGYQLTSKSASVML
jgi:hypothetical protein